jgi:hypothetical protein
VMVAGAVITAVALRERASDPPLPVLDAAA